MVHAARGSSAIAGLGWYVPGRLVDNDTIAGWCDVTTDWIEQRTGVHRRWYAADDEPTSALAAHAVRDALDDAGLRPDELAGLVVCTSTPDQPQPATAAFVLAAIGATGAAAFDVNAACAGFLYGLAAAAAWRRNGPVAVVGADKYSTILNRRDRRTVSLFGDGAGAVILGPDPDGTAAINVVAICEPEYVDLVRVPGGGSALPLRQADDPLADRFLMDGRAVLEWVEKALPPAAGKACAEAGVSMDMIDHFILHQANPRMLALCAQWLEVPPEKVAITADRYGNIGAASVALTLAVEAREGRIKRGDRVLLGAVGGGASACATVLTW